jgi:hypothetical protein
MGLPDRIDQRLPAVHCAKGPTAARQWTDRACSEAHPFTPSRLGKHRNFTCLTGKGKPWFKRGFDQCLVIALSRPSGPVNATPSITGLAHQLAGDFQLVDIATYRDLDRCRSGIGFSILQ